MQDFQQRVIDEHAELNDRLNKLINFFGTETFAGLPVAEKRRLDQQVMAMEMYERVLSSRILAFKEV